MLDFLKDTILLYNVCTDMAHMGPCFFITCDERGAKEQNSFYYVAHVLCTLCTQNR